MCLKKGKKRGRRYFGWREEWGFENYFGSNSHPGRKPQFFPVKSPGIYRKIQVSPGKYRCELLN